MVLAVTLRQHQTISMRKKVTMLAMGLMVLVEAEMEMEVEVEVEKGRKSRSRHCLRWDRSQRKSVEHHTVF